MRILAIDFGTVRIGTALSDELKMLASPYKVVQYSRNSPADIAAIVAEQKVETVVMGMPYALDGTESEMTRQTKNFAEKLRAIIPCPVVEWDEAFSSRKAGERMRGAGVRKKKRSQKGITDTWAAAIILQEYLDALR
ncbi:MAG: Holliday junction resolvase RuvX [Bacteroidota bacterium]